MDDRLDAGRLRCVGLGQQCLVVRASQRAVEAHHALDAFHPRHLLDSLSEVVEGAHPISGQRAAGRVPNDDAEECLTLSRKLLQLLIATPGLGVRRQHAHVAIRDPDLQEGQRHQHQQRHDRKQHQQRPPHHADGQSVPQPAAGGGAGQRQAGPVHAVTEDGQQGGKERERVEHGDGDHDGTSESHGREKGALEEKHGTQPDRDRDPGEGHRATGGPHAGDERLLRTSARGHLLAEAVHDEERIVDRHPETDQGDDIRGIGRYIGEARQHTDAGEAPHDGKPAHPQRQQHADHGGEDDQEQGNDDDQRDQLGPLQVGSQELIEVRTDSDITGAKHRKTV